MLKRVIRVVLLAILIFAALVFIGPSFVEFGGFSINFNAPDTVVAGEPVGIQIEVSKPGSRRDIEGRYTNVILHYRLVGEPAYKSVPAVLKSQNQEQQVYEFIIPPYPVGTSGEIEYYIERTLDGEPGSVKPEKRITLIGV